MTLHDCAEAGDIVGMTRELAQGTAIDALDRRGLTALMRATNSPNAGVKTLLFLLEQGADVENTGRRWASPALNLALKIGDADKIAALLDARAACNRPDVFVSAICSQGDPLSNLRLLLARGASIDTFNSCSLGSSPLPAASYLGRFEAIRLLLEAGADPQPLGWTALMHAIALGSTADIQTQLDAGADMTARDGWERTPWLLALQTGSVEKAALLLSAGADRSDRGRCDKPPLMYAINQDASLLRWLIEQGFELEAKNEFGRTALAEAVGGNCPAAVEALLQAGARFDADIVNGARSLEEARLFLARGVGLDELDFGVRSRLIGCRGDKTVRASEADYLAAKHRRFGTRNPELFHEPFWLDMLDSRAAAWEPRLTFEGRERDEEGEAIWCFDRFGCSITPLPDGCFIEVGGEHEDSYDPDFCIYNDVVVHDGQGAARIYGYPREVFPPTDFHSATAVGDYLYIIGCLGYPEDRKPGHTPVFRLHCRTLMIEELETRGDLPGWIFDHKACALGDEVIELTGGEVVLGNEQSNLINTKTFRLDLKTLTWTCLA